MQYRDKMANSCLICLVILACFGSVISGEKSTGYNVVSAEEFKKKAIENTESKLLRVTYFMKFDTVPGGAEGHVIGSFIKNYEESGKYLIDFKVELMTVKCKTDPIKEYCDKPGVESTVFVFRDDYVLDEMPMDILYNVDSIVANVLHLALLMEVPTLHTAMELASMKVRAFKAKKSLVFAKLMAIGTASDRAFMEGAFAYSNKYHFAMTTSRSENLLGTEESTEWEEEENRIWFFDCAHAESMDCERSVYYGPMTVKNVAIYLKTLTLPNVCEESNFAETLSRPLHEMMGLPVAYMITTEEDYDAHKQVMEKVGKEFKGNLVFAMNKTKPGVASILCPRPPPCVSIKPPGKHPMGLSKPFNVVNMVQLVKDWLDDYYFDPLRDLGDEGKNMFGEEIPEQEKQDDAVALAVEQMKPLKLNLTDIPHLTDKTFEKHLKKFKISIVTFTVKWDPRSLAFLHPFLQASKQIKEAYSWDHSPLARVECSDWPDVCDQHNVTRFPTIKVYQRKTLMANYQGALDTDSIVKAYKLYKLEAPVPLSDALDMEYFKIGMKPTEELSELVQSVVIAVVPEILEHELQEIDAVAKALQGKFVIGLCTKACAEDAKVSANAFLFVHRFDDPYREDTHFKGDFTFQQMIIFIEKNSMPIVPELTPASLPRLFYIGVPFVILFRLPGDEASDRIERVMAQLTEYEERVVMSWMDASPDSVGSRLLHDYNFPESNPPNLVFLDHATARVCNCPDVDMIESEKDLFGKMIQWLLEVLRNEGSCNAILSGNFEPQVPSYDFLGRIKENRQKRDEQAEGGRGRFGPQTTKEIPDEADDGEGDDEQMMDRYEDEMFGMDDKEGDMKKAMQGEKHTHTEL